MTVTLQTAVKPHSKANTVILTDSIADNGNTMVEITWWTENLPRMWNASQIKLNNNTHTTIAVSWAGSLAYSSYNKLILGGMTRISNL